MPKLLVCPFWSWEEARRIHCEAGRLQFPDRAAKEHYTCSYCASMGNWERCTMAGALQSYYDRKN